MDRSALKHFRRKASEIPGLETKLYQLGELAWKSLRDGKSQLLLPKVTTFNCFGFPLIAQNHFSSIFSFRMCLDIVSARGFYMVHDHTDFVSY